MADLPALLLASLNPGHRKTAEQNLQALSIQPGFLPAVLELVLTPAQDRAVRLAGSVYLKNVVKSRWEDDEPPIADADRAALRQALVPAMIALSNSTDKAVRAQVAEAISLVAKSDFPEKWPDLVDKLVQSLSDSNYEVNVGVLETAHSIFRPWRAATRSNELFTVINYVLSRFTRPFLELFLHTTNVLFSTPPPPNLAQIAQAQAYLVDIFYDLTCQDLPPDFEDTHAKFFGAQDGLLLKLLLWDPPQLQGDPDDTTPSLPSQIKTRILELVELYVKLYPEMLQSTAPVEAFVRAIWDLVGGGKRSGVADDGMVSQSLRFIASAIQTKHYQQLFGAKDTISGLVQGVVVPNVALREHEIEQFEDDPLEYIRLDLALPSMGGGGVSGDTLTRRQAAAEVLRALVSSGHEAETTEVASAWIGQGLQEYQANKSENWKAKDTAIYISTAVATKGATTQQGVTSTNTLIDVVQFFSQNVFEDLQAAPGTVHPILQVDAIRFLYTFRNQLVKEQLLSVLPSLVKHLSSENYVCYTYAAISIERILFIKQGGRLMFTHVDIADVAGPMVDALLNKIEKQPTPEKVAENDYLMKCIMRVIVTAKSVFANGYERLLQRLVAILSVISKNPSNPNFDQYIFESLSALMRFVVQARPEALPTFEQALFGLFTVILQQDIEQYIPYVFQILAQMLNMHKDDVPAEYRSLISFLLTPASWTQKGSIPGLVKLLQAFLVRDANRMVAEGQLTAVLGVIQTRLIPSKVNDVWGFELLQSVVKHVPTASTYFRGLVLTLLQRMQTSKTDKYVYYFVQFLAFTLAIGPPAEGLSPDFVVRTVEEIQPGLWGQLLTNFIIPQAPQIQVKDRKVAVVGLTRLLASPAMLQEPSVQAWQPTFAALINLFQAEQRLTRTEEDPDAGITNIDYEEQTAGYQAAYSRLAAAESAPVDPVAHINDTRVFLTQELSQTATRDQRIRAWVNAGAPQLHLLG